MVYRSSRGGISAWRQGGDSTVLATAKPRSEYSIRARGRNGRIGANLSTGSAGIVAGTVAAAAGVASVAFAGSARVAGTLTVAGTATAGFAGASTVPGSFSAAGTSTAAFTSGDASNMVVAQGLASVAFTGRSVAAAAMAPAQGTSSAAFSGSSSTPGGGTADPAAVWNYLLPNGKSAQQTLVEIHAMLGEVYRIHGLQAGAPLSVDKLSRTAGDIVQTITQVGDVVTIARTG